MSEKDQADRLNKQWDALVRTPRAARPEAPWTGDRANDTVHELHVLDDAARPDAEFRNELREQLLREAAFRTGQHHAAERTSAIGGPARPVAPSRRWIDSLAYAAFAGLLVLVTAAIIWGVDLRGDRTDDVTPTTLIAATTPIAEIFATPEATPSVIASPTIPVSPTATAQSTATPRTTPESAVTPQPTLDPTGTGTPVSPLACDSAVDPLGDVFLTLGETTVPDELQQGEPGSVAQSVEITSVVTEFIGCLENASSVELRTLVTQSLATPGVDAVTQSRLTELVVSLPVLADDVTEVAVLPDGRFTAMLRVNTGDPLLFVFDLEGEAPRITSLFVIPETPQTPTVTETADVEAGGEPNDGEVIDDDDNGFDEFEDDGAWDVDDDDLSDFDD